MYINISNIEENITKLNELQKKYDDIYLNYYNTLSNLNDYWQSPKSHNFIDIVSQEKNQLDNTINNIKEIQDIYLYIKNKYKEIGNKIQYNIENKDKIIEKTNSSIDKTRLIITMYNNLNISTLPQNLKNNLTEEKEKLIKSLEYLKEIKRKLYNIFEKIEELEKEINYKLSKIDIEIITETDIDNVI